MEAFATSVALELAALCTATLRMATIVRLLQKSKDPKKFMIGAGLLVEQSRTEEWARRMHVQTTADLQHQLPTANARKTVLTLLKGLQEWGAEAERMFASYGFDLADLDREPTKLKSLSTKLQWMTAGYTDMKELVKTLKSLNTGLWTIAPPPPGYRLQAVTDDSEDEGQAPESGISSEGHYDLTSSDNERRLLSNSSTHVLSIGSERRDPDVLPIREEEAPYRPIIELLYSTCQKTLGLAIPHVQEGAEVFRSVAIQLKVWESNLFLGPITLDEMLNPRQRKPTLLREHIIGVLTDIGNILEHLSRCLINDQESTLKRQRNRLVIVLGLEEIASAGLEEPEIFRDQPFTPAYSTEIVEFCAQRLKGLVEGLFEILVSIGTLRQISLAALRRMEKASTNAQPLTVQVPDSESAMISMLNADFIVEQATSHGTSIDLIPESVADNKEMQHEHLKLKVWATETARGIHEDLGKNNLTLQKAIYLHLTLISRAFKALSPTVKLGKTIEEISATIMQRLPAKEVEELLRDAETVDPSLSIVKSSNQALDDLKVAIKTAAFESIPSVPKTLLFPQLEPSKNPAKSSKVKASNLAKGARTRQPLLA